MYTSTQQADNVVSIDTCEQEKKMHHETCIRQDHVFLEMPIRITPFYIFLSISLPYSVVSGGCNVNKSRKTIQISTENAVAQWYRHIDVVVYDQNIAFVRLKCVLTASYIIKTHTLMIVEG